MTEFSSLVDKEKPTGWVFSVDGVFKVKGTGIGIALEGPRDIFIEQALKFKFTANNNQVEYETLIARMILALEIRASKLKAKSDSQLVANQISRKYQAKKPHLIRYLQKVQKYILSFHLRVNRVRPRRAEFQSIPHVQASHIEDIGV